MAIRGPDDLQRMVQRNAYPGEMKEFLEEQAKVLSKLLQEEIDNYYDSYSPKVYRRTFNFRNSIRVSPIKIEKSGNTYRMEVRIYFDKEMATHPSVMNGEDGFVGTLLNQGWHWSPDKTNRIPRFSDYDGFHFIQRAITRFKGDERVVRLIRIAVKASHNGVPIEGLDGEY